MTAVPTTAQAVTRLLIVYAVFAVLFVAMQSIAGFPLTGPPKSGWTVYPKREYIRYWTPAEDGSGERVWQDPIYLDPADISDCDGFNCLPTPYLRNQYGCVYENPAILTGTNPCVAPWQEPEPWQELDDDELTTSG